MVSLLNGPHTILVFTKERVKDEMGYELVNRPPIRLTGVTVQAYFGQSGLIDEYHDGTQVRSAFKVFGRGHWPGGVNSVIQVENGRLAGRQFDQDGEAIVFDRSPMTAHYEVNLTARAPESH